MLLTSEIFWLISNTWFELPLTQGMIMTYSSSLTCRILYPAPLHLSCLPSEVRNCKVLWPLHVKVSMPFLQSPLDVIWATTEWMERLAQKYVWFYNLPDKTYWQKIEQSCFSSMYLLTKFISGHMKIEQLLHVTACPIHDKIWFCWLVSPEVISNTMGNWETGKLSDCTHGLASRALPLWQFTVIQ